MKYIHEKMQEIQLNLKNLDVSGNESIDQAVDNQEHLPAYFIFHPCILCLVFFLVFLMVAK